MNESFRHPLDSIYPNNSLLLLEAMIPYVDPSLKLPLALLVKLQEIRILTQVLQNPSRMDACGLNRSGGSPEEMLSVLCQAMGMDVAEQMRQVQDMMNVMGTMNAPGFGAAQETSPGSDAAQEKPPYPGAAFDAGPVTDTEEESPDFSSTRDDMVDAIRQILSEQEESPYES